MNSYRVLLLALAFCVATTLAQKPNAVVFRLENIQAWDALQSASIQLVDYFQQKKTPVSILFLAQDLKDNVALCNRLKSALTLKATWEIEFGSAGLSYPEGATPEFKLQPIVDQKQQMNASRIAIQEAFEGYPYGDIVTFLPPGGSSTAATVTAANELGFRYFVDYRDDTVNVPFSNQTNYYFPSTFEFQRWQNGVGYVPLYNDAATYIAKMKSDITKVGYSMIALNPETFYVWANQGMSQNINTAAFSLLRNIIDGIVAENITIKTINRLNIDAPPYNPTIGVITTGPATTGPATTGPATTGQATTGQATTGPATTGQATTGAATTGQATTGQATTAPTTTGQTSVPATTGPATTQATTGVDSTGVETQTTSVTQNTDASTTEVDTNASTQNSDTTANTNETQETVTSPIEDDEASSGVAIKASAVVLAAAFLVL